MQTILSQKKILNLQVPSRYHFIWLYFKTCNYRFYPAKLSVFFFSITNTKFFTCVAVVIYLLERLVHISLSHHCSFQNHVMLKKFKLRVGILFFLILENLYHSVPSLFLQQQKFCIDLTSIFFLINLLFYLKNK